MIVGFFFQAEDGIRDGTVTGVQTCALPICNVPKRGWINGVGGCPNVGGICIGCTMPGFPDKFMPFMDEPPGAKVSTAASGAYGAVIRGLRSFTMKTTDTEPSWRK